MKTMHYKTEINYALLYEQNDLTGYCELQKLWRQQITKFLFLVDFLGVLGENPFR